MEGMLRRFCAIEKRERREKEMGGKRAT